MSRNDFQARMGLESRSHLKMITKANATLDAAKIVAPSRHQIAVCKCQLSQPVLIPILAEIIEALA
jgi:hypothetical protein